MRLRKILLQLCAVVLGCAVAWSVTAAPASAGAVSQPQMIPHTVALGSADLAAADPVQVSAHFVDQVIHDLPVQAELKFFRELDPDALKKSLSTQQRQLAFWINVYNGYTQYFLKSDPSLYLADRAKYFGKDQIDITGERVSLENIEHGVLRRGATIFTLGHLRMLFLRRTFIRRFAIDQVDYRVHFALNCGARSCPPVRLYTADAVNAQLDANTRSYLAREAHYDGEDNAVQVPALLRWFSADFDGGCDAAKLNILRRYGVIPANVTPRIIYRDYDWTLQIRNYAALTPSIAQ